MKRSALKTPWLSACGLVLLCLSSAHGLEHSPPEETVTGRVVKLSTGTFHIKGAQIERQETQGWKVVFKLTPVTRALLHRERGAIGIPDESIGPVAAFRDQIWYGISFTEGEGHTGVGGIGFFDTRTGKAGTLRPPPLVGYSVASIDVSSSGIKLSLQTRHLYGPDESPAATLTLHAPTADLEASMVGRYEKEKARREEALHAGGLILDQTCTLTERVGKCEFNARGLRAYFRRWPMTASNYGCLPGGLFSVHADLPRLQDYNTSPFHHGSFELIIPLIIPERGYTPDVPNSPRVPAKPGESWTLDSFDSRMQVDVVDVQRATANCPDPVAQFSGPVIDSITFRAKAWGIENEDR